MINYRLTASDSHAQSLSDLYRLIAQKTLKGQLEAFLITCRVDGLSDYTIKYYRYQVGKFIAFCSNFNITEPDKVTSTEIRLFILHLQEKNKPTSVHDYFRAVKRYFNWLIEQKVIKESPFTGIHSPKVPEYVIQPPSRQDIDALLLLTDGECFYQVRNRAMLLTFMDTGLRLSELSAIQLKDVNIDLGTIKVMGKGAKERIVRVGKNTQKSLLRYLLLRPGDSPSLWVTKSFKALSKEGVRETIQTLSRRAEITDCKHGPHVLRHYAATTCLRNGMQETLVQNMLGHSDLRMTRRYTKTINSDDMMRAHIKASPVDNL